MNLYEDLILDLNQKKYYEGFDTSKYGDTLRAGSMPADGLYEHWIKTYKPKLIIEVGSFLGYSAIKMAKEIQRQNMDTKIICIDTWLGGAENYDLFKTNRNSEMGYVNGYPTLYHRFISNVILHGVKDVICPFPYPSNVAFKILSKLFAIYNLKSDFIFVDGSHEELDVYMDLYHYYQLLTDDGVIWGDDWTWESVRNGVTRFTSENEIGDKKLHVLENKVHWYISK